MFKIHTNENLCYMSLGQGQDSDTLERKGNDICFMATGSFHWVAHLHQWPCRHKNFPLHAITPYKVYWAWIVKVHTREFILKMIFFFVAWVGIFLDVFVYLFWFVLREEKKHKVWTDWILWKELFWEQPDGNLHDSIKINVPKKKKKKCRAVITKVWASISREILCNRNLLF